MKLAGGKKWYGEQHLFGPGASYSSVEQPIHIPDNTNLNISLVPSLGGTLRERRIGAGDF